MFIHIEYFMNMKNIFNAFIKITYRRYLCESNKVPKELLRIGSQ